MRLDDSVIFQPGGDGGQEFAELAVRIRAAAAPATGTKIVPAPGCYAEWVDNAATHLSLDAMDGRGNFRPLLYVPMSPFWTPYASNAPGPLNNPQT